MSFIVRSTFFCLFLATLLVGCGCAASTNGNDKVSEIGKWSPRPPMGWNSFDAYDCRINEQEFKANVNFMHENLLKYGWDYAVIDYIWWHPEPGNIPSKRRLGHPNILYNADGSQANAAETTIDQYGRLLPSIARFPSANDGNGFKAVADYVHSKGMKFGIHIMRGIHRHAVFNKMPIKGTNYTADMIAEKHDTCNWNNHMYGVDASKPGAQEYYNSIFELYASWGVDFVKADDMMVPPYHKGEIEMMHKAILNCGRPILLSLSCGEAPLGQAKHLASNANMWRVSADFWDSWESLKHNFDLLNAWSSYTGDGIWPDADMIPFGKLSLGGRPHGPERMSNFTLDEYFTLMTLWSIARSPLIIGTDLLSMDSVTMSFYNNPEVIAVNQTSIDSRQVYSRDGIVVWLSTDKSTGDKNIAFFNITDSPKSYAYELDYENLRGEFKMRDLWKRKDLGTVSGFLKVSLPAHGTCLYKLTSVNQ